MRLSIPLLVAVVFGAARIASTYAQQAPQAVPRLNDQAAAPAADKEAADLLFDRYAAAYVEMEARSAIYNAGRATIAEVCGAITRYSMAGSELAKTAAGRVAVCEQAFQRAKKLETAAEEKYKHELEPVQQLMLATYTRCDMQLKLLQAKKEKEADKSADDSEVPRLIAPELAPFAGRPPSRN